MSDEWLERRFPGGGTAQERIRRLRPRRLLLVAALLLLIVVAAVVGAPALPALDGGTARTKVLSAVFALLGLVSSAVGLVTVVRRAISQAEKQPGHAGDQALLQALTWTERRQLLGELRRRGAVVPGDERALELLERTLQQASALGWIGLGQLCLGASFVVREQDRILRTVFTASGLTGLVLVAVAVQAWRDARAWHQPSVKEPS